MAGFVAHSKNANAVRQVRNLRHRAGFALVLLMAVLLMLFVRLYATSRWLPVVTTVLVGGALFATGIAVLTRVGLQSYLKAGTALKVDDSVCKAYHELVKVTHTNTSDDELFDRQQAMNDERDRLDGEYRRRWGREVPASAGSAKNKRVET